MRGRGEDEQPLRDLREPFQLVKGYVDAVESALVAAPQTVRQLQVSPGDGDGGAQLVQTEFAVARRPAEGYAGDGHHDDEHGSGGTEVPWPEAVQQGQAHPHVM